VSIVQTNGARNAATTMITIQTNVFMIGLSVPCPSKPCRNPSLLVFSHTNCVGIPLQDSMVFQLNDV